MTVFLLSHGALESKGQQGKIPFPLTFERHFVSEEEECEVSNEERAHATGEERNVISAVFNGKEKDMAMTSPSRRRPQLPGRPNVTPSTAHCSLLTTLRVDVIKFIFVRQCPEHFIKAFLKLSIYTACSTKRQAIQGGPLPSTRKL